MEAAGVSPASADYKKQVDGWNAKVNAFKVASPEQLAAMRPEMDAAKASMEKARQGLMKEADADFKRQQSALVVVSDDGVLIQPAPTVGVTVGVKVQPTLKNKTGYRLVICNPLFFMVGVAGFELATPCTPCKCATRLRYTPKPKV